MIKFYDLGLIEYKDFLTIQEELTPLKEDIILFCRHYPIFTTGKNDNNYPWALKVDRGGSITYFDEGSLMVYFIFNVTNPPLFFRKIRKVFDIFFDGIAVYDKTNPGYYIGNKKIASLGFSYKNNRSNHGIAINVNTDLVEFNKINPCNLSEIKATSLYNENIDLKMGEIKIKLKEIISLVFGENYETTSDCSIKGANR